MNHPIPPEEDVRDGVQKDERRLFLPLIYAIAIAFTLVSIPLREFHATELALPPLALVGYVISQLTGTILVFKIAVGANVLLAVAYVLVFRRRQGGHYGEFVKEEQRYRIGSEHWQLGRKAQSCLLFGLSTTKKFFVPASTVLTTIFVGAAYLVIYKRAGLAGVLRVRFSVLRLFVTAIRIGSFTLIWWLII